MSEQLKFAIKLTKDAGKILMNGLNKVVIEEYKVNKQDIVTNMDLMVEQKTKNRIKKEYRPLKISNL